MATFGGDSTTVTLPDGTTRVLPSEVAGMFPGLQGSGGAPLGPPAGPAWSPADSAGLAMLTPPADVSQAPVTSPAQVPNPEPAVAPRPTPGPATEPGQPAGTQPVTAPAPPTNAQLAKEGPAGTLVADNRAIDEQQAAVQQSARVTADEATKQGAVLAARDAQTQQILAERAQIAADNQAKLEARMTARDVYAKQIADTRIDRSVDHPIWAAIATAFGVVGGAMQQKQYGGQFHNAALDAIMQGIDRKVAGQMQDLDAKRAALGQMNVGIGEQRQMGMDRISEIDARRDGALQQAKQVVETIGTQMKSPAALATAAQLNAKLDEERATLRGAASERAQAQINAEAARRQAAAQHAQTIALQREQLAHEDARFYYGQQMAEKEKMAQLSERMLEKGDLAAAKRAKLASEQGIVDPRTGDLMLTPEGDAKLAQADAAEAQARQASDPQQQQALNQRAQALRESAKVNDAAIAINPKLAAKAQDEAASATDISDRIGKLKALLESDPSFADRGAWAKANVIIDGINRDYASAGKERLSPAALKSLGTISGIDPNDMFSRVANKEKAIQAIGQLREQVTEQAVTAMRTAGIKSRWSPSRDESTADFSGKTSQEIGADAEPGALGKAIEYIKRPISGASDKIDEAQTEAQTEANARRGAPSRAHPEGETSNYGLDPKVDETARALIKRAGSAGHAAYATIVQQLAAPLTTDRPGLSDGVARLIRDTDPKVMDDVLHAVAASAGAPRAQEIAAALRQPDLTPAAPGGVTPGAAAELDAGRARAKQGLPSSVPASEPLAPVDAAGSPPGPIPAILQGMTPEQRQRYLDHIRANGFAGYGQ